MDKRYLLTFIVGILLFGVFINFYTNNGLEVKNTADEEMKEDVEELTRTVASKPEVTIQVEPAADNKTFVTNLKDVTEAKTIRYTDFNGESTGRVEVNYSPSSGYLLNAIFNNLPDPSTEHYYEGWVVTSGENVQVLSTGEAVIDSSGNYVNNFSSDQDLTDHTFYVLTIEPRDGNPRPEEHILEGILVMQR